MYASTHFFPAAVAVLVNLLTLRLFSISLEGEDTTSPGLNHSFHSFLVLRSRSAGTSIVSTQKSVVLEDDLHPCSVVTMSVRGSGESRRSFTSQGNPVSETTFVNRERTSLDEARDRSESTLLLNRTRSLNRTTLYAERDAENIRSAEREASRMSENREVGDDQTLARVGISSMSCTKNTADCTQDSEIDGDSFDQKADHPAHLPASQRIAKPIKAPLTKLGKLFKWVHNFSMLTRWFLYITPIALILLVPVLIGALHRPSSGGFLTVAGVSLQWFAIWWEIIWLSLWAAKLAAKLVPLLVGPVFSVFTNSYKKWRDLCIALEVALTLFFWWLAIYISFVPIVTKHQSAQYAGTRQEWQTTLNRIVLTIFIATVLNLIEKFLIQLVAIGFHQRQYEDRIVMNKFQITSLTKLYKFSRENDRLAVDNDDPQSNAPSGVRTPNQALNMVGRVVQKTARDAVGKVAGEIAGRRMEHSTSPRQVVLSLLDSTAGAQTLARRLFASYHAINQSRAEQDYIIREDMRAAFAEDEEADAAFAMFDKDFNGDVTCEEMEIACVEMSKERKSITSSLKDLDHAVSKLDDICVVIVAIVVILIFISLISRSFTGVLSSAGTTILGLSWLFSQLAQEFLASIVFVFVKHPFDVGDRVDIYMNGVVQSLIVKEISLMATEFRLLDGRIVQAPNNVLNQLFILNMRRTGGVAEGVPTTLRFGVSIEKIDALRQSMVDFVRSEPRDYKPDILSELTDIPNLQSVKFTLVFFHKQNWQNEGLRIGRRNKFMCALMTNMQRLGMESSIYNGPGGAPDTPMYLQYMQAPTTSNIASNPSTTTPGSGSINPPPFDPLTSNAAQNAQIRDVLGDIMEKDENEEAVEDASSSSAPPYTHEMSGRRTSVQPSGMRRRTARTGGIAAHMQRVDYSLGATDFAQSNTNDFFEESQERGLQAVLEVAEEQEDRAQRERFEREKAERKSASRARSPSMNSLQRSNTNMTQRTGSRLNRFRLMPHRRMNRDGRKSGEYDEEYNLERLASERSASSLQTGPSRTADSFTSSRRRDPSPRDTSRLDMAVIPEASESPAQPRSLRRGNTDMSFGAEEVLNVTAPPSAVAAPPPTPAIHTISPSPAPETGKP